jgi:hypothetical protein
MKRVNWSFVVIVLTACALLFTSANQSAAGQSEYLRGSDGRIRMKHSPALGINIPISVWIDGRQAGAFAKGHVYERYLTPGRHEVYASRPGAGRQYDAWYSVLDVQPGETYSFVVKCTPNRVLLLPVGRVN